jgi:hypothetical protein
MRLATAKCVETMKEHHMWRSPKAEGTDRASAEKTEGPKTVLLLV